MKKRAKKNRPFEFAFCYGTRAQYRTTETSRQTIEKFDCEGLKEAGRRRRKERRLKLNAVHRPDNGLEEKKKKEKIVQQYAGHTINNAFRQVRFISRAIAKNQWKTRAGRLSRFTITRVLHVQCIGRFSRFVSNNNNNNNSSIISIISIESPGTKRQSVRINNNNEIAVAARKKGSALRFTASSASVHGQATQPTAIGELMIIILVARSRD